MLRVEGAVALSLGFAVAITAAVLQGCAHVEYQDPKSVADTESVAHPLKAREISRLPNPDVTHPPRAAAQ